MSGSRGSGTTSLMPSIRLEDLTPFGRVALKLDAELAELAKSGEQVAQVDLDSEKGLDEGIKILNRVALYGQSVAETMQEFSASLQDARGKAEAATALVSERAQIIMRRKTEQERLEAKLSEFKEEVRTAGASLSGHAEPVKGPPTDEDKKRIAAELERVLEPMTRFIATAQALKEEAAKTNFKRLERQADAMIDSLQATRRKITQVLGPK